VLFIIAGLFLKWPDFAHKQQVESVLHERSVLDVSLLMKYAKPPIYTELYSMHNDNGISTAQYRVQGYSGKVVTITLPPTKTYDVSFFFQQVVLEGIWQLDNKPAAGNAGIAYTLHIHQVSGSRQGERTILFTDPHYWATTAGRQYHIVLNPHGPVPDLTKLQSTSLADPRYEKIVQEFRNFGTPSFRAKVAQARQLVSESH
jgi:hypothetical protein